MRHSSTPACALRTRLGLTQLEARDVPSAVPTAVEQVFLERLNDARSNPAAYGAQVGVNLSYIAASAPLAFDARLIGTAQQHSQDMNARAYFAHNGSDGSTPFTRMSNAGYPYNTAAESIAAGQSSGEAALAALIVDSGTPSLGHRNQLLSYGPSFQQRDVGVGIVQNGTGPYRNYYTIDTGGTSDTRPYLTGVVYRDANGNSRYDAGEGVGGATVAVAGGGSVTTWDTGGYSLRVNPGTYTVTVSGAGLNPTGQTVSVGSTNYRLNFQPATVVGPEIQVLNGATDLADGAGVADFGTALVGQSVSRTFTVNNVGTQNLTLGALAVPAGFTLTSGFGATTLAPGASTTFTVRLNAAAAGTSSGAVSFVTNDADEGVFDFTVVGTVTTSVKFDFGTGASPVAAGYTGVTNATAYSAAAGYGWAGGSVGGFDTGIGSDAARDFNYTAQGTFAVDVPNGTYDVKVTLGDNRAYGHDLMGVFLEGAQVDSVTTYATTVTKTYTVTVTDGQLTLLLRDLGGSNPDVVIEALEISSATPAPEIQVLDGTANVADGSGTIDFGTALVGQAVGRTFTVKNLGTQDLTLGVITVPAGFTVTSGFGATTLAPGASTMFTVRLDAATAGAYSGTVSFATNDADESPFDFAVTGTATSTSLKFDFGTGTSPVSAGYTGVTAGTTYTAARGYGWAGGTVLGYDTGIGTDVARDFNYTVQGTFAVDVPNGTYDVRVTLGDTRPYGHDLMGVFLEGAQADSVTTAAGEVVTKTYTVAVADGQLTLLLRDLGGSNPDAVIEALQISAHV